MNEVKPATLQAYYAQPPNQSRSLAEHIRDPTKAANVYSGQFCRNCRQNNHITDNCRWLGKPKCDKCGWFGHVGADCRREPQKRKVSNEGGGKPKRAHNEAQQAHITTTDDDTTGDNVTFTSEEMAGVYNFDTYNPHEFEGNDERLFFYDWVADTATTSYVTNMRDAFCKFETLTKPVRGVGNAMTYANGKGSIRIETEVDGKRHQIMLENVLFIPSNPHNLLSLERWDSAGGNYHGGKSMLTLYKDDEKIAISKKINNHLYKMKSFTVQRTGSMSPITTEEPHSFSVREPAKSWEVWHKRYGHIGMDNLQELLTKKLVDGLTVNIKTPKYDCIPCMEAKQHVESFPTTKDKRRTELGELTHTDVWGSYSVQSIHGNIVSARPQSG